MAARISLAKPIIAVSVLLLILWSFAVVFDSRIFHSRISIPGFAARVSNIRDRSVLVYNRIPKTGSLSMERMIRSSLEGRNGFAFHHEAAFKKRHLRRDEQVNSLKGTFFSPKKVA